MDPKYGVIPPFHIDLVIYRAIRVCHASYKSPAWRGLQTKPKPLVQGSRRQFPPMGVRMTERDRQLPPPLKWAMPIKISKGGGKGFKGVRRQEPYTVASDSFDSLLPHRSQQDPIWCLPQLESSLMAPDSKPPAKTTWMVADLLRLPPPCSPSPPPRRPAWSRYRLSESMKGLLVALFGGGVPAGFVAPFTRMANEASGVPSLEILLFRCVLHLLFVFHLHWRKAPFFGPSEARQRVLLHASVNVISIGCAYSSFMVVPSGNAATVRKGSSTICSVLLALCIEKSHLTCYDWFGLVGSTLGLLIMVVPDLLNLDKSTQLYDTFGYVLACLGGLALALGLEIFRALDFPVKLVTVTFMFGVVGSLVCSPVMFLLQDPVMTLDPLTWTCVMTISLLALVSFLCASYAVTKAHPALVCAVLHSEVVVTLAVQYYVLREAVTPFDIMGAGVILGSIVIITAQNISCDSTEDDDGVI